jgi:hypothetical protein
VRVCRIYLFYLNIHNLRCRTASKVFNDAVADGYKIVTSLYCVQPSFVSRNSSSGKDKLRLFGLVKDSYPFNLHYQGGLAPTILLNEFPSGW